MNDDEGGVVGTSRRAVADFWDTQLRRWCSGRHDVSPELRSWFESYVGKGKGAVDLGHYPDPYVGDLRGVRAEPRLVILGLNPGVGYGPLQGPDGIWTRRIGEQGYSHCFRRSPAEDQEEWFAHHGKPSKYWENIERFTRRWLCDDTAGALDVLNLELYPWHSVGLTGTLTPPVDVVERFVWDPVQEIDVPDVFAFGKPWFSVCEQLGLTRLAHFGAGRPWPVDAPPTWELAMYQLPSGQIVVVSAQPGFAGPPGSEKLEIMRGLVAEFHERMDGFGGMHDPGIGLPWEVQQALSDQGVRQQVYRLFARLAQLRSFTVKDSTSTDYAAIAPLHDRAVAVYVHPTYLDVAVAPEVAQQARVQHGWHVVKQNPTTAYLRIGEEVLKSTEGMQLCLEVITGAIDQGEQGATYSGPGKGATVVQPSTPINVCSLHATELLGGECDQCS